MYSEINFTEIGITIKMFRAARHITQMEMAKRIGISQTHLSNIESGRVKINLRLLIKMANIFECKLDDFFVQPDFFFEDKSQPAYPENDRSVIVKMLQILGKKHRLC